jgi:hypothetical protein
MLLQFNKNVDVIVPLYMYVIDNYDLVRQPLLIITFDDTKIIDEINELLNHGYDILNQNSFRCDRNNYKGKLVYSELFGEIIKPLFSRGLTISDYCTVHIFIYKDSYIMGGNIHSYRDGVQHSFLQVDSGTYVLSDGSDNVLVTDYSGYGKIGYLEISFNKIP